MNCDSVLAGLRDFVDRELEDTQAKELEAHCASCPPCQSALESERDLKNLLAARGKFQKAPPGLGDSILRSVRKEAAKQSVATAKPSRGRLLVALSLLLAVALGVGAWWHVRAGDGRTILKPKNPSQLTIQAVNYHQMLESAKDPRSFVTDDRGIANKWFEDHLEIVFQAPAFRSSDMELTGGCCCRLIDRTAGVMIYRRAGKSVSMFVMPAKDHEFQKMGLVDVAHMVCAIESYQGYQVICWKRHGLLYVMIVKEPEVGVVDAIFQAYQA